MDGRSCTMVMTSVLGHVKELDFGPEYGNWSLTPPDSLFEAEVKSKVADVRMIYVKFFVLCIFIFRTRRA